MTLLIAFSLILGCACRKSDVAITDVPDVVTAPVEDIKTEVEVPDHVKTVVANFSRVYFDTDGDTLNADSKAALDDNVAILQEHPDVKVQIQGHTDERGTTDYNLALGDRRANAVKEYLAGAGVGPSRLTVVSYGEELPAANGSNERAWSQNRRAEFVVTWGGEGGVQGTTK